MAEGRNRALSDTPSEMTPRDVSRWVSSLGGSATQISQVFAQQKINGFSLMSLSDADLKGLGVRNRSVRNKILMGTEKMKAVSMQFKQGSAEDDFDFVDLIKQWGNFAYYFSDYVEICELIVEYSGLDIPFPGSDFRKIRRGDCVNYYKLLEVVGKGAFGTVHKVVDKKTSKTRAAKIMPLGKRHKAKKVKKAIMKEIDIMKVCKHENVIQLVEYFSTKDRLSLILEFLAGKNLLERLLDQDGFSELQALSFFKQMANAIFYLHSIDIVHRDVKLDNFLLENWSNDARIVLADYGLSHRLRRNDSLKHPCGTLGYTAPEVIKSEDYDLNCDIWSLGVCLFVMLCGFPPFEGDTQAELRDLIVAGDYSLEGREWKHVSKSAQDLVRSLLAYDRHARHCAQDVLDHPWLSDTEKSGDSGDRSKRSRVSRTATCSVFNSATETSFSPLEGDTLKE